MKESCIRCGKETEYDVDTPVTERSCYIPKMGQMCFDCFCEVNHVPVMHGIYSFKRIKTDQAIPASGDGTTINSAGNGKTTDGNLAKIL